VTLYPSVAEVEALTPPTRDRGIDVVRLGSLLVVVTGHSLMALVVLTPDELRLDNLLAYSPVMRSATWVLQVLPLFFFAGAASATWSYKAGAPWGPWLFRRAQRLYRPVFFYLAFWLVVLAVARAVLPRGQYEPIAGLCIQLLWFLGVYVVVLASVPPLTRIATRKGLLAFVAAAYAVTAVVDAVRLNGGPSWLGFVNFLVVWLIPAAIGVAYAKGFLTPRVGLVAAALAFVVDLVLVGGPYEVSLVTAPGQRLSNMTPPSLLLAGHAFVICGLAVALMGPLRRLAARGRVWWFVAIGNSGAMTLYLWHLPVLLAVIGVGHALGHDRANPHDPGFWTVLFVELACVYVGVAIVFTAMYKLENVRLPWWDAYPAASGARGTVVGVLVVAAGVVNLVAARWGLRGPGIACVAMLLTFLVIARLVAGRAPERARVMTTDDIDAVRGRASAGGPHPG
jgi:hypothetical protein